MEIKKIARLLVIAALAALTGCSRSPGVLVRLPADIGSLLPDYDRAAIPARKAEVLAGTGDYVTVGAGRDYETLGAALDEAPPGVRVFYLMDPVHRATDVRIARDASIRGFGARDTVLEAASEPAGAAGGVISVVAGVNVYISGVTVRGGKVTDVPRRGGGVSNSGRLVMEDCAVIENMATYGVGLWTEGRLEMRRCVVAGNVSLRRPQPDEYKAVDCGGKGGGLRVEKGGFLDMADCLVAFNDAIDAGGALHVSCEAGARLVDTTLYGNTAGERGGAVDLAGGDLEMARCTVAGNVCGGKGQALFHRGRLSLSGCLFADNGPGRAYYLSTDKGGEYGRGLFAVNEGNFDDSGSLPLAATGGAIHIRLNAGSIRRNYGARAPARHGSLKPATAKRIV